MTVQPFTAPGVSRLVAVATPEYPRHSEGDLIELADGRLLLAWGRKNGASDFATGELLTMTSADGGETWDTPRVILAPWDDNTDVMSVSLVRTPRGLHLFFLGRGPAQKEDTRIYRMCSTDEGASWGAPVRVNPLYGYHVVNNARVLYTTAGRLLIPVSFCRDISRDTAAVFCLYSDDEGDSWQVSARLAVPDMTLQEPGLVECADGSIYMTIRTTVGFIYESRSRDGGATWDTPVSTGLVAPAAPATLSRDPQSDTLWLIWCANPRGRDAAWAERNILALSVSHDHGRAWSPPRDIERDPTRGMAYTSIDVIGDQVHLTYYDWENAEGHPGFYLTSIRHRIIPLAWFRGERSVVSPES